ncbi:MAG: DUF3488 domain-containing protein [Deltaproteobacteria bacterium]|nr:DUF3488 domain-containing protein [Deltaproteobacteria bacterium]
MLGGKKRVDFLLRISIHALILCGLIPVILTGEIPWPIWLLALGAHPLSILTRPKKGGHLFNLVVILSFFYSLFLYFFLATSFLIAFTQLLILVQALKLFHLEKAKDYFQLGGLVLLMLLAAAGLTSHLYYLLFFLIFVLLGIWFLFLLHLKADLERYPQLSPPPRHLASFSLLLGISGVAFCSFFFTLIIFFTLPRISLSVSGKEKWGGSSSGFSEIVDLADIESVRLNNRVVMRVELPQFSQKPPLPLYWRGISFSRWDGQAWVKEVTLKKIAKRGWREGVILYRGKDRRKAIYQRIMIEPMGTDALFCLYPAFEIRGDFSYLNVDEGGGLHLPSPPYGRYQYEVYSALKPWEKGYQGLHKKADELYLQLPEGSEYIVRLTQDIIKGEKSPRKKVHQVISYLRNNYTYSLNPARDEAFPPLEDFLLHSREGYCEHFATAAALLLRGAGVPTRLVCGFVQGEWNPLGRYFMVRQRDAHAWIEAYLPDSGWFPFDPTPASAGEGHSPFLATFYRYLDFLKLKWSRYIIRYSHDDQLRVLFAFRRGVMDLRLFQDSLFLQKARGKKRPPLPSYLLLAGLASLCVILLMYWGFKKRGKVVGINLVGKLPPEISFYLKMLKLLNKKTIPKRASETPIEFAQRVGQQRGDLYPTTEKITLLYYRVRFGQIPLAPHEKEEIWGIIRDLKERISSPPSSEGS